MATAPLPKLGRLEIRIDRVYGKITIYPACERSKLIAEIAGTTTLTSATLARAERLGFEIFESVTPERRLAALVWNRALAAGGAP